MKSSAGPMADLPSESRNRTENLALALTWLRGALDCKDWHWDPDQRDAAEESYRLGTEELATIRSETANKKPDESDWWKDQPIEEKLRLMTAARDSICKNNVALYEDAMRYRWLRRSDPVAVLHDLFGIEAGRNPDDELDAAFDKARDNEDSAGDERPQSK